MSPLLSRAVSDASYLLRRFWDGPLPIDPVRVAYNFGVRVYEAKTDADVMAATDGTMSPAIIYLSERLTPTRQRWMCAHSLAHIFASEAGPPYSYIDYEKRAEMSDDEAYADLFAAELLMPSDWMTAHCAEGRSIKDLSKLFQTSEHATEFRLKLLRLQ